MAGYAKVMIRVHTYNIGGLAVFRTGNSTLDRSDRFIVFTHRPIVTVSGGLRP